MSGKDAEKPSGEACRAFEEGEHFEQTDLARTLEAVAETGREGFYGGWVADRIVQTMEKYDGLILLERSLQAQFLIPMATSLSFGVLFATFITLLLVPALYLILEDIKRISQASFWWVWHLYFPKRESVNKSQTVYSEPS